MNMYKYLDIRTIKDSVTIKRFDITSYTERQIDQLDLGLNRKLNHEEYYTSFPYESEEKKELIDISLN